VLNTKAEGMEKKPYHQPILRVYGDVRTLTQTSGNKSMNSDGLKGHKT
jgi:hypothetical protein